MNRLLRSSLLALSFAAVGVAGTFAADPAALVDFGKLTPSARGEFIEVNLGSPLLKFAAVCASKQEPAVAELIRGLKQVRVHVVGLDDSNRAAMSDRVASIRRTLPSQGWSTIVTARGKRSEDVVVFARMNGEETIEGLVITVMTDDRQAVLVNIVGQIKAEQIATLAEHLNIDGLKVAGKATRS